MDKEEEIIKKIELLNIENNQLKNKITKNEQLIEALFKQNSLIFKHFELKPKGILRNLKILNQELMNFFVNVCKKYNIPYWIDYGTLLGAVRHGGYIPWDDDIDLGMMRKDYNHFIKVIYDELKLNGLNNVQIMLNSRVISSGIRIAFFQMVYKSEKGHLLAALDLFPYDFLEELSEDTTQKFIEEQNNFIKLNVDRIDINEYLIDYYKKLNLNMEDGNYIISGIDNNLKGKSGHERYKFTIYEKEDFFPLIPIKFNNQTYLSPNNVEKYLQSIYGDYEKIPRNFRDHNRISSIKKEYDDDYYEKHIKRLRKINRKFSFIVMY